MKIRDMLIFEFDTRFPSGGPDNGTCDDPNFPITIPRIFLEASMVSTMLNPVCL